MDGKGSDGVQEKKKKACCEPARSLRVTLVLETQLGRLS